MLEHFDPTPLTIALLIWPAAKSLVFMAAASTNLWSRHEGRQARAERLLRIMQGDSGPGRRTR